MVFSRRNSATVSTSVPEKPTESIRLIDGSKSCSNLLEDHLQYHWCGSHMNIFTDRKGRLCGFLHREFLLEFKFSSRDDNSFYMYTCVYCPKKECGDEEDLQQKVKDMNDQFLDKGLKFKLGSSNVICLVQKVSAASLLVDEDVEQTLEFFFDTATAARKTLTPKKTRRLSWFSSKQQE